MTLSSSQSPRRTPRRKFVPSIWLATALIGLYQRYISPYKGFRCAHRVLHGSRSCSSYNPTQAPKRSSRTLSLGQ